MKNKFDLPGAILVAALLLAGVGALALKEANLGTTLIGLAIGIVMPSPISDRNGGGGNGGSGVGGAAVVLIGGLLTLQGCTDVPMPAGLSLLLGVLAAFALTGAGAFTVAKRLIAGVVVMLAVGCGGSMSVPAYAVATTACVSAEHAISARENTSTEQDASALAALRDVCDAILSSIRELAGQGAAS